MKQRRAFTLVEIVVVLCLVGILLVPIGSVLEMGYRHFTTLSRQADAKTECQHAGERIFRWLSQHPKYQIDSDNHGLSGADGSRIRWREQRLEMTERGHMQSLLKWPVADFAVLPHRGGVTLNLTVDVLTDSRSPLLRMHEIYDYPRVGPW
ncbi:MAG: prepilin-type N-terminal cleavage/methylation domain-containing protein [Candidatus Eremiobacteraeota bacterium]|nr:prepilin-type N-terminal cleavage/methylation domain-containing protein [Candidatus Eremiobacteraeota bacterium]MCW5869663.1 prepilin-type N-terminal cleavage/methylation domain-containing protein [Candidatus Eremiobacteraeota bacterium]